MVSRIELAKEVEQVQGKLNHLLIRSELTLYVLSAIIETGAVKREGVEELIREAKFNAPEINEAIIQKEKEIVLSGLNKVTIS
ncbi:hypothetical protein O2651_002457 [Salmonella enterica]|uniref:Uncharacterized protein n=4 Tax=Salmonella enterica TaxID=28901 RepID=A0A629RY12_SALMO|nr:MULTISPECIES: hypothetical protein [Salmonella]EAA4031407.1 hypothetical protein [Salmonella enterica subsp. enterica serovar Rissen]EAA6211616.1 hypothetical protein [Salmonella enterica subsp. enterica serovar Virchow]EAA8190085.1 hypothetical protein [Salmonella enterica subsp. enterica serovar Braenderup]EAA8322411.1 hypothetical protein [Salmonella enterica subsp. enterica]EAB6507302.1 hypothetical protein [Salmonella enterica subsp. enterica serovar Richmond]EAS6825514.1 hypothetical